MRTAFYLPRTITAITVIVVLKLTIITFELVLPLFRPSIPAISLRVYVNMLKIRFHVVTKLRTVMHINAT